MSVMLFAGGLMLALAALVHGRALRRAAELRPTLEEICGDHAGEPLPAATRATSFVSECLVMVLLPWLAVITPRHWRPARVTGATPVILVHPAWGRGFAWPLAAWLSRSGTAVDLVPAGGLVAPTLSALEAASRHVRDRSGAPQVDVIALGAAGLVARIYASQAGSPVRRLLTIATPHQGTFAGWPLGGGIVRPDSALVREAALTGAGRSDVACINVYSPDDPALLPATAAYLRGALTIEVRGLGHVSTFASPRILSLVSDALSDTTPAALPQAS